jgi:hypothetical protein
MPALDAISLDEAVATGGQHRRSAPNERILI